ncbi:MAG: nitroreductase family protein, partial [Marinoscillum sp.]
MNTLQAFYKHTPADHQILDVIKNRWSPRSFSDQPINQETLNRLFESVRWAPSAMNEQPWRFIVARKG